MLPHATPAVATSWSRLFDVPSRESSSVATPPTAPRPAGGISEALELEAVELSVEDEVLGRELEALQRRREAVRSRRQAVTAEVEGLRTVVTSTDGSLRDEVTNLSAALGWPTPYPYQLDGVCSVISGVHTVVVQPAGGGKGLMTLLTAAMRPGKVVVVIVPLVALAHRNVLRDSDPTPPSARCALVAWIR